MELFSSPIKKVTFEDVQIAVKNKDKYILINTLPVMEQDCLILNTISYHREENLMNELLGQYSLKDKCIIVYGKNVNDDSVEKKYRQLVGLGFQEVYAYLGGLFEWVLLQDIYGKDEFPTTSKILDILKFRGKSQFYFEAEP